MHRLYLYASNKYKIIKIIIRFQGKHEYQKLAMHIQIALIIFYTQLFFFIYFIYFFISVVQMTKQSKFGNWLQQIVLKQFTMMIKLIHLICFKFFFISLKYTI